MPINAIAIGAPISVDEVTLTKTGAGITSIKGATGAANAASGVVVLDSSAKLPAVNGSALTNMPTDNSANLLAAITPTLSGWNTNPASNADMVNELTEALTTNGVTPTGATYSAIVKYDLGASKRVQIMSIASASASGAEAYKIEVSDDDITYYLKAWVTGTEANSTTTNIPTVVFAKCRYVRFGYYIGASGNTWSRLRHAAYLM